MSLLLLFNGRLLAPSPPPPVIPPQPFDHGMDRILALTGVATDITGPGVGVDVDGYGRNASIAPDRSAGSVGKRGRKVTIN